MVYLSRVVSFVYTTFPDSTPAPNSICLPSIPNCMFYLPIPSQTIYSILIPFHPNMCILSFQPIFPCHPKFYILSFHPIPNSLPNFKVLTLSLSTSIVKLKARKFPVNPAKKVIPSQYLTAIRLQSLIYITLTIL